MKKLLALSFLTVLILGGCARDVDYKDASEYTDYLKATISDSNDTFLSNTQEFLDTVNPDIDYKKEIDNLTNTIQDYLDNLSVDEAQNFYDDFTVKTDEFVSNSQDFIDDSTKKLSDKTEEFLDMTKDAQKDLQNKVQSTLDDNYSKYSKKITDAIPN